MTQNDRYVMKTVDIDSEEMDIPDMDVEVEITADSSTLQKYIKNTFFYYEFRYFSKLVSK